MSLTLLCARPDALVEPDDALSAASMDGAYSAHIDAIHTSADHFFGNSAAEGLK